MTPAQLRKHCLALPGAECIVQWGDDQIYKIAGKMFASTNNACTHVSFKCSDEAFHMLVEAGIGVPAPYLGRAKWVRVCPEAMPETELKARITQAYAIVRSKLTRKLQSALPPFDGSSLL